jgi:hypothetical protein
MDFKRWLSEPRFDEYLVAANHDFDSARELYEWNIAISGAFFELISHVEVAIRNAVDNNLRRLEVPETARIGMRHGWWFTSSAFLAERDLAYSTTAERFLGDRARTAGRDKTLSAMTLGMWDAIFHPVYEQLFRKHLVYAFPHRPEKGFKRDLVYSRMFALRVLRNRIAHHQGVFDLPLEDRFEQAMEILGWIDPDLESWVRGTSRVQALLNARPAAAESMAVVVPAGLAWPFYQSHGVYVCQPGRFFRQISHVAFYHKAAIQPDLAKILERLDHVSWKPEEIQRRIGIGTDRERRIGEAIRDSRAAGWVDDEYQLFLLTQNDSFGIQKGHVHLVSPVPQTRRGRGSAWVHKQRYASVGAIQAATTVADLD